MTRFVSSANQTAAEQQDVMIAVAVDLDFASGHVRAHDAIGTLQIGGFDYLGVGQFGSIDTVDESIDVIAKPVRLSLSGVDASLLSPALTENYQNRSCTIYLCLLNKATYALVDTPEVWWEGRMSHMKVTLGTSSRIDLQCEHRLRREPRIAHYTDADMQLLYSGDRFFDLLGKILTFKGMWGSKGVANDGYTRTTTPSRPSRTQFKT